MGLEVEIFLQPLLSGKTSDDKFTDVHTDKSHWNKVVGTSVKTAD